MLLQVTRFNVPVPYLRILRPLVEVETLLIVTLAVPLTRIKLLSWVVIFKLERTEPLETPVEDHVPSIAGYRSLNDGAGRIDQRAVEDQVVRREYDAAAGRRVKRSTVVNRLLEILRVIVVPGTAESVPPGLTTTVGTVVVGPLAELGKVRLSVPPLTVTIPLREFELVRASIPGPETVRMPAPLMTPERVWWRWRRTAA